jgi:pilus assembly protein CpaE
MSEERPGRQAGLSALLVSPDAELARQLAAAARESRAFFLTRELREYPDSQTMESRVLSEKPDVVFVDYAAAEPAAGLTRLLTSLRPSVCVVGLHRVRDPQVMLSALSMGASEFLHAPFQPSDLREAAASILRHRKPEPEARETAGQVLAFASAKPGSGASMLACYSAIALRRVTGARVLLADLNLAGGTIGFTLRLKNTQSVMDALEQAALAGPLLLDSLVSKRAGVDVLTAPDRPFDGVVQPGSLERLLTEARREFAWVLVDLPAAFHRLSLQTFWDSDRAFVVSTPELPGLYLARKAVTLLGQLGMGKDRVEVLVNRTSHRDGVSRTDLKKVFGQPVDGGFPCDTASLLRAVTLDEPLEAGSDLGKAIEDFAGRLAGLTPAAKRAAAFLWQASPVLSGT